MAIVSACSPDDLVESCHVPIRFHDMNKLDVFKINAFGGRSRYKYNFNKITI